jgi:hypothetical protein
MLPAAGRRLPAHGQGHPRYPRLWATMLSQISTTRYLRWLRLPLRPLRRYQVLPRGCNRHIRRTRTRSRVASRRLTQCTFVQPNGGLRDSSSFVPKFPVYSWSVLDRGALFNFKCCCLLLSVFGFSVFVNLFTLIQILSKW